MAASHFDSVVHRSVSKPSGQVQTRSRVSPTDRPLIPCRQSARPIADVRVDAYVHASSSASRTVLAVIAAKPRNPCDDSRICSPTWIASAGSPH